jgi:hypothetical protein
METLRKQVARAHRRLMFGRFMTALAWCWFGALLVAAAAIAAAKLWPIEVDGWVWAGSWIGGSMALGLIAAAAWTWVRRREPLTAAIEIDRRFGLKERVSSALALSPAEAGTDAGRALINDAVRRIERIDVPSRFKTPLARRNLLPLLPALIVFGLMFIADRGQDAAEANAAAQQDAAQRIQQPIEVLRKKLADPQKEAAEKGLKDFSDLLKKIEAATKDLVKKDAVDQKQALVKLNDLAKELEKRREQVGGDEKLKQQLAQMKDLKTGPGDKLAEALKNGNFDKALKELDKLKDQLKDSKLDPAKQQQLAEQLDAMRKNLERMVEKHEQAKRDLERQVQQAKQSGKTAEAQKLQQQLDKLKQQAPQMDRLKQLASQCKQCAGGLKSGQAAAAQQAMDQLGNQLADLKRESDELQMLDQTLDQLAEAKESMCKGNCPGGAECDKESDKIGDIDFAKGKGRASGRRPESPTDTKFYDSNVKQKIGRGSAVVVGDAYGPNSKGDVKQQIKIEIESAKHDSADPLVGQRLPKSQREHAKEYFDALREGK